MSTVTVYEVGGCVRDQLLEVACKDIDYAVEARDFAHMREWLEGHGFKVFLASEQYLTIRAHFPVKISSGLASVIPPREQLGKLTADFVLCRSDGDYSDGRRPDQVHAGTIGQDLARRDFTVNAIARAADGSFVDPFDGRLDLADGVLRAVGDPVARLGEDSLRALRAVRFAITKGFSIETSLWEALAAPGMASALASVSAERRREELHRAFALDTLGTLQLLATFGPQFLTAALADGLWLKPTSERP